MTAASPTVVQVEGRTAWYHLNNCTTVPRLRPRSREEQVAGGEEGPAADTSEEGQEELKENLDNGKREPGPGPSYEERGQEPERPPAEPEGEEPEHDPAEPEGEVPQSASAEPKRDTDSVDAPSGSEPAGSAEGEGDEQSPVLLNKRVSQVFLLCLILLSF